MNALDLLHEAERSRVTLRVEAGRLRWKSEAPPSSDLIARLRTHKAELLELLATPNLTPSEREDIQEVTEERAAIREFDGGEVRAKAEHHAEAETRVYRYKVADKPSTWLILIAPGCDLEAARHSLELRFGDRLMAVVAHKKGMNESITPNTVIHNG